MKHAINWKRTMFIAVVLIGAVGLLTWYMAGDMKGTEKEETKKIVSEQQYISALEELLTNHPDLQEFVDEVYRQEEMVAISPEDSALYFDLGLAWKSVADRAGDAPNVFYDAAYTVYSDGIDLTDRKDTVFLANAANMAEFQRDYTRAEALLLEAMAVTPGDQALYIRLADMYRYHMNKTADEIIALVDKGIDVAVSNNQLITYKEKIRRLEQEGTL